MLESGPWRAGSCDSSSKERAPEASDLEVMGSSRFFILLRGLHWLGMGGITGFLGWLERARVSEASNWVMNWNSLDSWWSLLVFGLIGFGFGFGFAEDFDCRENFMVRPS